MDVNFILARYPAMQEANKQIVAYEKEVEDKLTGLQQQYDAKISEYEAQKASGATTEALKVLENKIIELQQTNQKTYQEEEAAYITKKEEITQPVLDKINGAATCMTHQLDVTVS